METKTQTFVDYLKSITLEKQLYMAIGDNLSDAELNALENLVDRFCHNYVVSVSSKMIPTHLAEEGKKLCNEIRVTGTLEKLRMPTITTPEGFNNQYRIVVSDSNYVYFSLENISEFGTMGLNSQFKGGQHLVLGIKF